MDAALRFGALALLGITLGVGCFEEDPVHPFPSSETAGGAADGVPSGGNGEGGNPARGGSGGGATGGSPPATGGLAPTSGGTASGGAASAGRSAGGQTNGGGAGRDGTGGRSSGGAGAGAGAGGKVSSNTGGAAPAEGGAGRGGGSPSGEEVPAGYVKGIVAVGYGGLRVVSRDDGKTWSDAVDFGEANADDENLLRAVAYGNGRWIATGWRLLYSDDGVEWTQHSMVRDEFDNQQIIEGLAYKDGYFYGAGDPGRFYRSADGLTWESYGSRIGDTEKHTTLAFRGGVFVAYGDSSTSFQSMDGMSWTEMSVADATYCEGQWRTLAQCHDAAWFEGGFYLRVEWGGQIQRSTNGSTFDRVYQDPAEHTAYKTITFAEGYVTP